MNMASGANEIRRGPTGRENVVRTLSPSLHPGLFSLLPSGKRAGASPLSQRKEPALTVNNLHAIALGPGCTVNKCPRAAAYNTAAHSLAVLSAVPKAESFRAQSELLR